MLGSNCLPDTLTLAGCAELDDEKSKVQLLKVKALNAKREAKEDAEAEAERKRVAAMSAEEFKEHQLRLHTKAEAAKELARNLESALEPLQHAESKQYRCVICEIHG